MIHPVLALIMVMIPLPSLAQGTDWYISDGAAIRYEASTEQEAMARQWSLSIQKSSGTERIVHHRDGKPVTTLVRYLDSAGQMNREAVEENGKLVEERLFNAMQQMILERFFVPDGSVEEIEYTHKSGRLISSIAYKDGKETGSRTYLYYPDGRLAGIREQTATRIMPTGMEKSRPGQTTSWTGTPEGLILSTYDNAGRLVMSRNYKGTVLVSTEERIWRDGRLVSLSTAGAGEGDNRVVLSYDEAGRLESRVESKGKDIVGFNEYSYDQDDRLVFEKREAAGILETQEFMYDSSGKLLTETRTMNGLLALTRTYTDPDEMLEEHYDKGKLFARVLFKGGLKVRETILSDGKPVRERNF